MHHVMEEPNQMIHGRKRRPFFITIVVPSVIKLFLHTLPKAVPDVVGRPAFQCVTRHQVRHFEQVPKSSQALDCQHTTCIKLPSTPDRIVGESHLRVVVNIGYHTQHRHSVCKTHSGHILNMHVTSPCKILGNSLLSLSSCGQKNNLCMRLILGKHAPIRLALAVRLTLCGCRCSLFGSHLHFCRGTSSS